MKMIYKIFMNHHYYDHLSPLITLHFKGNKIHSSFFSGILTIIAYLFIFIFTLLYIINFINKTNPIIYYYNRYVEEAGTYPLNESALFHYIHLINKRGNPDDITIDFESIRIIGIKRPIESYMNYNNLREIEHWVYGSCNYNEINDTEIRNLISPNIFSQSACIKEYYNQSSKKYSKVGEPDFQWPVLAHGASNPNRIFYGIIVEKCHNDSLKNSYCKTEKEINEFFMRYSISLNIIDEFADVLNYKNPYTKYIYALTNGLAVGTISVNNLNFNPSITKTHVGFFFENIIDEESYAFSQNEKITMESGKTGIVAAFYFWMQNIMIYNERSYRKFEDLFSDIGGFGSFILLIAEAINSLVTNYVILLDTEELVLNIDKVNYEKNKLIQKPTIYRKVEKILNPPKLNNNKNKYNQNQNQSSKIPIFIKEGYDNNINTIGTPKSEPLKILFSQNKRKENNIINQCININMEEQKKDSMLLPLHNKNNIEINKGNQSLKLESCNENLIDFQKIGGKFKIYFSEDERTKNKNNDENKKSLKKQKFTWFNYFFYIICLKRNSQRIKFFEDVRAQLISEENILQNYSDIYKLLKICKIKNHKYYEINAVGNS